MSNKASDTLAIARSLKAAGVEAEKADAFVEAVARSTGKFVTVEHFDAAVERLDARIDAVKAELLARIDAVKTEMQASMARSHLISVGIMIAANALMVAVIGFVLTQRAGI